MKIITYIASNGQKINLTPAQIELLEAAGKWPKTSRGEEFATVSHGLHWGEPTHRAGATVAELLD